MNRQQWEKCTKAQILDAMEVLNQDLETTVNELEEADADKEIFSKEACEAENEVKILKMALIVMVKDIDVELPM